QQILLGETVDVAEVARVADDDADGRAPLAAGLRALDAAVVEGDREARAVLDVEVGEVAPAREGALEHAGGELGVDEAAHASSRRPSSMRRRPAASSGSRAGSAAPSRRPCPTAS